MPREKAARIRRDGSRGARRYRGDKRGARVLDEALAGTLGRSGSLAAARSSSNIARLGVLGCLDTQMRESLSVRVLS